MAQYLSSVGAGRYLGNVESSALGPIVVYDGLGNDVLVKEGERKGFPVQLDRDGFLYWTVDGSRKESIHVKWTETAYVEVIRRGQAINWACSAAPSAAGLAAALSAPVPASVPAPSAPSSAKGVVSVPPAPYFAQGPDAGSGGKPLLNTSTSQSSLSASWQKLHGYIQEAPYRVNAMCFAGGCAVVVHFVCKVLDPFSAVDDPSRFVNYTVACYGVFFGLVTCLTELRPDFAGPVHDSLEKFQERMHEWAKALTMLWGRGFFYIIQGTLILASAGLSDYFGCVVGVYMILCGVVLLSISDKQSPGAAQENYIRVF